MDQLNINALDAFTLAVRTFLTQDPPVQFKSLEIRPTGLGGLIGLHADPELPGDLLGRKVKGILVITATGNNAANLNTASMNTIRELIGVERKDLMAAGIHRLDPDGLDTPRTIQPDQLEQDIRFTFRYEYVHQPETAGDVIDRIDVELAHEAIPENFEINEPST